jgi:hypothetical protein
MIINDCFAKYGKPERAPAQTQHPEQHIAGRGGQGGAADGFPRGPGGARLSMAGKMRVWERFQKTVKYLHIRLHSFTFLEFKSNLHSYLQAYARDLKASSPQGECGFDSHSRYQGINFPQGVAQG